MTTTTSSHGAPSSGPEAIRSGQAGDINKPIETKLTGGSVLGDSIQSFLQQRPDSREDLDKKDPFEGLILRLSQGARPGAWTEDDRRDFEVLKDALVARIAGDDQLRGCFHERVEQAVREGHVENENGQPTAFDRRPAEIQDGPRAPEAVATAPLSGGFEEVTLQATQILRERPGDPAFAWRFTTSRLAVTVRRLEDDGVDAEHLVDLAIHLFAGEAVYQRGTRPTSNRPFREVLLRMTAMIDPQLRATEGPSLGLLETSTNLVTWFGMAEGNEKEKDKSRLAALQLAVKLLPIFLAMGQVDERHARMLSQLANNVAGWISDRLGLRDREDEAPEGASRKLNTLHAVATVAYLRQTRASQWAERALPLFDALGMSQRPASPNDAARALVFMSNIPSAWRIVGPLFDDADPSGPDRAGQVEPRYRTMVLAGMSAVMRSRFNPSRDADEISSSLFNLGVDALRINRGSQEKVGSLPLRLLANGLGLWWALSKGRNLAHAMNELNGADCTVNLMGALADTGARDFVLDQESWVRELSDLLLSGCKQAGKRLEMTRLLGSYRSLFGPGEQHRDVPFAIDAARLRLCDLLCRAVKAWMPGASLWTWGQPEQLEAALQADYPLVCATGLRVGFETVFAGQSANAREPGYADLVGWWVRILDRIAAVAQATDYAEASAHLPADLAAWGVDEVPETYEGPVEPHLLSSTFADAPLMAGFFGIE